jgi:hypothetical protein
VDRQAELASALPMTLPPWVAFGSSPMLARSAQPSSDPDRSLDEATSCSQSQIGRHYHLRRQGMVQVEAALVLSVVVRWGPVKTAVNGTLVARRATMTMHTVVPLPPTWSWGETCPLRRTVWHASGIARNDEGGSTQPGRVPAPSMRSGSCI